MTPFFSIVIPTRNKAHHLHYAIQSCLDLDYNDYEIVISDNNSTDNTSEIIHSYNDKKIRYVNPGKDLSLANNFEHGIINASGQYVLMLADDETYKPSSLHILDKVINETKAPIISFGRTGYYFPNSVENGGNYLDVRPFTRNTTWISSKKLLDVIFDLSVFQDNYLPRALPLSVKSIVKKDLIDKIIGVAGRFQLPPTPDWTSCIMMLSQVEEIIFLDEHLNIAGYTPESNGPKFNRTRQTDAGTMQDAPYFSNLTPLKFWSTKNVVFNAILTGQQAVQPKLDHYTLNWQVYFSLLYKELKLQESYGLDVKNDWQEFFSQASNFNIDINQFQRTQNQTSSTSTINTHNENLFRSLKQIPRKGIRYLKNRLINNNTDNNTQAPLLAQKANPQKSASNWPIRFHGDVWGFSNILECSKKYDAITKHIQADQEILSKYQEHFGNNQQVHIPE